VNGKFNRRPFRRRRINRWRLPAPAPIHGTFGPCVRIGLESTPCPSHALADRKAIPVSFRFFRLHWKRPLGPAGARTGPATRRWHVFVPKGQLKVGRRFNVGFTAEGVKVAAGRPRFIPSVNQAIISSVPLGLGPAGLFQALKRRSILGRSLRDGNQPPAGRDADLRGHSSERSRKQDRRRNGHRQPATFVNTGCFHELVLFPRARHPPGSPTALERLRVRRL